VKILLIQLKRLGDLILTVPAVTALRKKFPNAIIHLALSRSGQALAPAIPGIDRFLVLTGNPRDIPDWITLMAAGYDYCLDLTRNDRSAMIAFLSRAHKKITFERTLVKSRWRPFVYDEFVDSSVRYSHTVDHHLAFLAPLGIHNASGEIYLELPSQALRKADEILARASISSDFVIFHPGSARIEKFWEAPRWAKVIDYFAGERGLTYVLTSGRTPMELAHTAEIKASLRHPIIDFSGKTDLLTLAALIHRSRLLVAVDSAPTHLAAALGTPQVALYGPTNPFHWRPRLSPATILQAGAAAPLTQFSPNQRPVPMDQLSTKHVIDAIESVLSARTASIS